MRSIFNFLVFPRRTTDQLRKSRGKRGESIFISILVVAFPAAVVVWCGHHKRGKFGATEKIEFPLLPPFTPLPPFPPKKQRKDEESSSLPLHPPSCKSIFFRSSSSVEGGEKKLLFFPLTHHSISHVTPLLFSPVQNNRVSLQIKNLLWLPSPFSRGHAQAVLCVVK